MIIVGCQGIVPFLVKNLGGEQLQKHLIIPAVGEKPEQAIFVSSFSPDLAYEEISQEDFLLRLPRETIITQSHDQFTEFLQAIFPNPKLVGIGESFQDIFDEQVKGLNWEQFWILNVNGNKAIMLPCFFTTKADKTFVIPGTNKWPTVEQSQDDIVTDSIMSQVTSQLTSLTSGNLEEVTLRAMEAKFDPKEMKITMTDLPLDNLDLLEQEDDSSILREIGIDIGFSNTYKVKESDGEKNTTTEPRAKKPTKKSS